MYWFKEKRTFYTYLNYHSKSIVFSKTFFSKKLSKKD